MTATTLQTAATVVAGTFLLVGVLGFIPGITTGYDSMTFAGLVLAISWNGARAYLIGGGAIYLVLGAGMLALGLALGRTPQAGGRPGPL